MTLEEFMRLFHGAVAAVENGHVMNIDLEHEFDDVMVRVSIYKEQYGVDRSDPGEA
jgi:hypothetical protein